MGRLEGKVAFVTGAAGGIGAAICRAFLAEGAMVAACDLDQSRVSKTVVSDESKRMLALRCDVTNEGDVMSAVALAIAAFGKLDILCNVAGGSTPADGPVTEAPVDEFWRAIRVDLFGTFLACRHVIPELIRSGGGSVINLTSVLALVGVAGKDCYTAAKGGVSSLTRSMAVEYATHRVRVNAIAPGVTLTPRVKSRLAPGSASDILKPRHMLGFVEPEDISSLAVYLAADESQRITGQILRADSGMTSC